MILGFLMLGVLTGAAGAAGMLIAGHGLLAAFTTYVLCGILVTLGGAALALVAERLRGTSGASATQGSEAVV